jgi:hypothetical protein
MRYSAPTISTPRKKSKISILWYMFSIMHATMGHIYEMAISYPMLILNQFGINLLPTIFAANIPLWSFCLCGIFLGVAASATVGLGVGLGVGLTCAKTGSMNGSNSSNSTIFNSTTTNVTSVLNTTVAIG